MTKSQLFTQAHALTSQTVQAGDSYSATFAICLRVVYAEQKQNPQAAKLQKILDIIGSREHTVEHRPHWIHIDVTPDFMGSYAELVIRPDGSHEVAFGRGRIADAISAC